jgi:hypothetical protein
MRHANNGGAIHVMTAVFRDPRIYRGAPSWRNTCGPTRIVLSVLKIAVMAVINHVTLNEVK